MTIKSKWSKITVNPSDGGNPMYRITNRITSTQFDGRVYATYDEAQRALDLGMRTPALRGTIGWQIQTLVVEPERGRTYNRPGTAVKIKDLPGYSGMVALYHVSPPAVWGEDPTRTTTFVVASTASAMVPGCPETYLFPADSTGKVLDWLELPGSMNNTTSHALVLYRGGWELHSVESNAAKVRRVR